MEKNELPFEEFCQTLQETNKTFGFFVDWDKCLKNRDDIAIFLNHLNFLLGKNNLKLAIEELFNKYKDPFAVLPILLAVRNQNEHILDENLNLSKLSDYTKDTDSIYKFITQSGLDKLFRNKYIKDLNDYVFGIEVGLDTNARKNRSGTEMENCITKTLKVNKLNFESQVSIKKFKDINSFFGSDQKIVDFVIYGNNIAYFVECNFYSVNGSKLNEVARAYQEVSLKFDNVQDKKFVWITDGQGWLGAKNKLQEAYKVIEIYNLTNINNFIKKIQNA